MKVFLIRHTPVVLSREFCYGQVDIDVAQSFDNDAESVKRKIPLQCDEIFFYSSPLKRCVALARHLTGKDPHVDPRLMEMNFGDWELKKWKDINKDALISWSADYVNEYAPGGESFLNLISRSIEFWGELISKDHKYVAIITHSGVIHAIIAHVLEMPPAKSFSFNIDYGSISLINIKDGRTIVEYINR